MITFDKRQGSSQGAGLSSATADDNDGDKSPDNSLDGASMRSSDRKDYLDKSHAENSKIMDGLDDTDSGKTNDPADTQNLAAQENNMELSATDQSQSVVNEIQNDVSVEPPTIDQ